MKNLFLLFILAISILNATAKIYYVTPNGTGMGTSWTDAERDLQLAINKASSLGDSVWVKEGLYLPLRDKNGTLNPSNPRTKCFVIISYSKVFGGYLGIPGTEGMFYTRDPWSNPSVLSGDLLQNDFQQPDDSFSNDNCYNVIVNDVRNTPAGGFNALIDGFTISRSFGGSGMLNIGANLVIRDCLFTKNKSEYGGGMYNENANPTIIGCHFRENIGNGGGICSHQGKLKIYRSLFMDNNGLGLGGGILNKSGAVSQIENCWFYANMASLGGAIADNGFDGITQTTVVNCTVNEHILFDARAFYCSDQSVVKIMNCIVWGNGSTSGNNIFKAVSGASLSISYSDIQGGYTGTGNINSDPMFARNSDVHLKSNSPCIDKGETTGAPLIDFDGNNRVVKPDLGCFENGTIAGVRESNTEQFLVSPNPFIDQVFFEFKELNVDHVSVTIFNSQGKKIHTLNIKLERGIGELGHLNLANGVYIFEIEAGDKTYFRKMTAQ
jgi:hypothetical protein